MQRQDEDELELSVEALAALKEFAIEVRACLHASFHPIDFSRSNARYLTLDTIHAPPRHLPLPQRGLVSGPSSAVATDPRALRKTVQESCALTERDEGFEYAYGAGEVRHVGVIKPRLC